MKAFPSLFLALALALPTSVWAQSANSVVKHSLAIKGEK